MALNGCDVRDISRELFVSPNTVAQDSRQMQLGLINGFWAKGDCRIERITK
jgi:hypothetical protein